MTELSVVVLCYHSGKSILSFFNELESILDESSIDYEIILVANDFAESKDQTIEIVKQLAKGRSRVSPICKVKQGMMGWDMIQGLDATKGNYICVIDGDGQFPIDSILKVYHKIKATKVDLVKTYRKQRNDGLYRFFISKVYNILFKLLFPGLNSKDVNSKPKIMSRNAYAKMNLQSTDWFIDAEIMINAKKMNFKIMEIPISFSANESRKSFVQIGAILEFINNLFIYKYRKRDINDMPSETISKKVT